MRIIIGTKPIYRLHVQANSATTNMQISLMCRSRIWRRASNSLLIRHLQTFTRAATQTYRNDRPIKIMLHPRILSKISELGHISLSLNYQLFILVLFELRFSKLSSYYGLKKEKKECFVNNWFYVYLLNVFIKVDIICSLDIL